MSPLDTLHYWMREREAIRIRKVSGAPPPWTDDPILAAYRFCNVRREDDLVTRWVREHIREPYADHPHLPLMLCVARQFNWPDTLAELMRSDGAWPSHDNFSLAAMVEVLAARTERGDKVYTGAYKIGAPTQPRHPHFGKPKYLFTVERVLGQLWERRDEFSRRLRDPYRTMQGTHAWLDSHEGWGPFLAYQVCVDMRFTSLLRDAPDVQTWAAAGPGTIRGLNRLAGRPVCAGLSQWAALKEMRALVPLLPQDVALDFTDVPNVLCEVDKWLRTRNGEGVPKTRYRPEVHLPAAAE